MEDERRPREVLHELEGVVADLQKRVSALENRERPAEVPKPLNPAKKPKPEDEEDEDEEAW